MIINELVISIKLVAWVKEFICNILHTLMLKVIYFHRCSPTMADDNYVCSLSEESLKKAKKELHEDPRERLGAVKALREWILQQPHMKCQTGDNVGK